jgi:hypothetical protein
MASWPAALLLHTRISKVEDGMSREKLSLRAAAVCLVIGSLVAGVARMFHGDLPAGDAQAAVRFLQVHPYYVVVHLSAVLGALVATGGYVLLASTFARPWGWVLGRLGMASALVGMAVFVTDFSTDGRSGQSLGAAYAAAAPAARPDIVQSADTIFTALYGASLTAIAVLWGLTLILFALALNSERYPAWLAWPGLVIGAVVFIAAIIEFLVANLYPGVLLYGGLVSLSLLWGTAVGVTIWFRPSHVDSGAELLSLA